MDDNYYSIYTESVLQLAESIVIKSSDTAKAINDELYIRFGPGAVDQYDPKTWKYYLNLAGIYHYDDEMIQVISMDTLETINFTKENLQFHRTTAKAYGYGKRYYKELVNRYPKQERLILGILYPADLDTAVGALDGAILSYPPHLVEDHEYSLIRNLQQWIYSYLVRWDNAQFKLSDNLYCATMLGIMYQNLVPAIMMLRKKACKTNEVHSFHLQQYLASNGLLDSYLMYMTRSQALWLYRNIKYIQNNSGKQAVFEWLTEHIMTRRGLPLASYEMRHDLSNQPAELKPLVAFRKNPLNTSYNYDLKDEFTLTQVMDKEDPLARDNTKYRDIEQRNAARMMEYSLSNKLSTKLLESSIIDYTGSERYTLAEILLYHWLWLSDQDRYRTYISVTSPLSGELLVMTAKEAFAFYTYAFCATIGLRLETMPKVIAERVVRLPKPSLADVMSVVEPKVVSAEFAQNMLNLIPTPQAMISVDSFYEYCVEVQYAANMQYNYASAEQYSNARGQKMGLITRCWADVGIQLGEEGQYCADWFAARNITISEYTTEHLSQLAIDLLAAATGVNSSSVITLDDIQKAMVRIMAQLTSYSVQYTTSINIGPILDAGESGTRPDNVEGFTRNHINVSTVNNVLSSKTRQKMEFDLDIGSATFDQNILAKQDLAADFEIKVEAQIADGGVSFRKTVPLSVGVSYDLPEIANNDRNVTNVLGIDTYLSLTHEQQTSLPDFWHL